MKNIFIIGEAVGSYRTQNLVKILLDEKHKVYYNSCSIITSMTSFNLLSRILRKILISFERFLFMPQLLYQIAISNIVILPAMNSKDLYKQVQLFVAYNIFRKPVLVDFYISYYDSLVLDREKVNKTSFKAKLLMLSDRNVIKYASSVVFLNKSERDYYLSVINLSNPKIKSKSTIIPLCVDIKKNVGLPYFYGINKELTICWWGSYIPLHGLNQIIGAAEILRKYNLKFKIWLFGNSEEKSIPYKDLIREKKLDEFVKVVNNYTFQNYKLTDFLVHKCDLVLGNFGDSEKAKAVLVNKLVDGIAMKAPLLTGESKASEEFFDFKNDIWRCNNNPEDIARTIQEISNCSIDEVTRRTTNAYNIYLNRFSVKSYQNRINEVINEVSR
ncbi:MAG: hypothetical protein K9L62_06720 [Vallitaleaceae bacterium]|nr:hypothetical protein [Vallitaleaceae bacterium]